MNAFNDTENLVSIIDAGDTSSVTDTQSIHRMLQICMACFLSAKN